MMISGIKDWFSEYLPLLLVTLAIISGLGTIMLGGKQRLEKWNDKEISYEKYLCVIKMVEYYPGIKPAVQEKMNDGKLTNSEFVELDCNKPTLEIRRTLADSIED